MLLTYGSGYLAGMKLGDTPLLEYARDRLHRETVRSFGSMAGSNAAYELTSTYTPAGQLQSQHLNSLVYDRDYGWNDNGDLVRISGPRQTREYGYSATGGWQCTHPRTGPTSASRMPRTRRATGCRTRSCTRTVHSRRGRITASRRMRTMSTATMNTAG
ncbi:hypothetical protein ECZU23_25570 [Escherichia coli]|nr:hypothetical protein ECZU23_25570 [Escherichia coli]